MILTSENKAVILSAFGIPPVGEDLLSFFFTDEELCFILAVGTGTIPPVFGMDILSDRFPEDEYRNGLVSKTDASGNTFRLNNFYGFLDVFCVSDPKRYESLPHDKRIALDDWYFDKYLTTLDGDTDCPTTDSVLPLAEMLAKIDADDRPVYLNYCDCRSLRGACGRPRRTCITYKDGINTFTDRGISERIDKKRAKEIILEADRAGLMHTSAMGGICNCCGDCCYLIRAQKARNSSGIWPASAYIVQGDPERCIGCGLCADRCHFEVFGPDGALADYDSASCVGCGLCVNTCPAEALTLVYR